MALSGLKVIELAGLAPAPYAGLVLADNGADVIRVDRIAVPSRDVLCRKKRSIALDVKSPGGITLLSKLLASADVVIDPFRPGVMERLGLGPRVFFGEGGKAGRNERLIYARIAGFPRSGLYKDMAGHDINYIALSGVLSMLPGATTPEFPLNLLADFAGGGLMCVLGILLALIERGSTSKGKIVDIDMVTGTRYLSLFPLLHALRPTSTSYFSGSRGTNLLDGGAPFYAVYACSCGGYVSVGCLEPQFFEAFLRHFLGALPPNYTASQGWQPTANCQFELDQWPRLRAFIKTGFLTNSREYWTGVFFGTDACVVPVLSSQEADLQAVSPLPTMDKDCVLNPGTHTSQILTELGLNIDEIRELVEAQCVVDTSHEVTTPRYKL